MANIVVGSAGSDNLVLAQAPLGEGPIDPATMTVAPRGGVVPFAPSGMLGTNEPERARRLTPPSRSAAMARAMPLEELMPSVPSAGSAAERKQRVHDYFYQRRESFTQSLLAQHPELRNHPQTLIDLADQWVARNVVRGMSPNRAGIAAINARGMLIAIDARIRELEASGATVPGDLLSARQAAAATVNEVRAQLRAKGFSEDEANRYLGFVGPRINASTQGWEQHVTAMRNDPNYTPVQIPPAAPEGPVRQSAVIPAERPAREQVRIAFQPVVADHSARARADREAGNDFAVAHANERIALARVVMAARLRQDLHIGGPLSSLV